MNFTATQTHSVLTQDVNRLTVDDIRSIVAEAKQAAQAASRTWLAKWNADTGGNQYGEPMYCGFAWINIYGIKGNTKLGKRFKDAGVQRGYDGSLQIYNPSGHSGQSMDVKEQGAYAAARVFEKYGFRCYAGSRAD